MERHGTHTALLCNDRPLDQPHAWGQLPWRSTHYSEGIPKKFSVIDAGDLDIMRRIVPLNSDLASDSEQRAARVVAEAKGVTP